MTSLGTVTTGTYNATIGSSATFPSGHVVDYKYTTNEFTSAIACTTYNSATVDTTGNGFTVSGITAGNLIYATIAGGYLRFGDAQGNYIMTGLRFLWSNSNTNDFWHGCYHMWDYQTDYQSITPIVHATMAVPSGCTSVEILRRIGTNGHPDIWWDSQGDPDVDIQCHVWEIQQ